MLRSPSSLRSFLHLSGRLLRHPSPRFPGHLSPPLPSLPRSTRPRFLTFSSPTPGGAGWVTYDYDPLIDCLCASAYGTPAENDAWVVYDPVVGRIVIQRPLSSSSTEGEGKAGLKEREKGKRKGRASASGEVGRTTSPSSLAAAGKSAGKGGKERVSYMCSHCGEGYPRWWGVCRHCRMTRTLHRRPLGLTAVSGGGVAPGEEEEEGKGAVEPEGEGDERAGVNDNEKGRWKKKKEKRKRRASTSGEDGQTIRSYVCSHCGEHDPQWWGICRHCMTIGTLHRRYEMKSTGMVPQSPSGGEEGDL